MQSQEHQYNTSEEAVAPIEPQINTDPREQEYQQRTYDEYQPYSEGYSEMNRSDAWRVEGEKLRSLPKERHNQSGTMVLLLLILCALIGAGNIYNIIGGWLSWLIMTSLVVAGAWVIISNWRMVTAPIPVQTFQVAERPFLVINNSMGTISLRRGQQGEVSVTGIKRASGVGVKLDKMEVTYNYNERGNVLNITGRSSWSFFQLGLRSIDLEITVPEGCDIETVNGSGRIIVQDTSGRLRARTGSGRIDANNIQGMVDLHTGSGRINFNGLYGQIKMLTGSGRIEGYDLRGQLDAKTGSGRIEIERSALSGDTRLKTGSGSMTFEGSLDPKGSYQMATGSGRINFTLPDDAAFSLKASTGSGRVDNEFGSNEVGEMPRPQLKLRTGSGSIRIIRNIAYRSPRL